MNTINQITKIVILTFGNRALRVNAISVVKPPKIAAFFDLVDNFIVDTMKQERLLWKSCCHK